jgi:starch phosphorylase
MKAAMNGGLNLSVLDGWWCEGYDGTNGWAIASDSRLEPGVQDARDAAAFYDLLEREIVPLFYARDERGILRGRIRWMKASLRAIGPAFNTARTLNEYLVRMYRPLRGAR